MKDDEGGHQIGQVIHGDAYQNEVRFYTGDGAPDPKELSDEDLSAALKKNGQLRESFRLKAALPGGFRAALALVALWVSKEPIQSVNQQPGGTVAALTMMLICVVVPWFMFRVQVREWREEQLAVLELLKRRRAPLLLEKAHRLLDREPSIVQRVKQIIWSR